MQKEGVLTEGENGRDPEKIHRNLRGRGKEGAAGQLCKDTGRPSGPTEWMVYTNLYPLTEKHLLSPIL